MTRQETAHDAFMDIGHLTTNLTTKTIMKNLLIWFKTTILKYKMRHGIVKFSYTKKDGTIRTAIGTLKKNLLPETLGTGRKPSPEVLVYYDTEKASWRSFRKENLLTF